MLLSRRKRRLRPIFDTSGGAEASYPDDATIAPTMHDTIPNFAVNPDVLSAQSGNWSSTSTWQGGVVPQAGDVVGIQTTHTVTYDVDSTTKLTAVGVAGKLTFLRDSNTQLWIQHLLVYGPETLGAGNYGHLDISTEANPTQSGVTAEVVFTNVAIDTGTVESPGTDPAQYGNGLHVFGKITTHGVIKTRWLRLGAEPQAEDTTLTLSDTVTGWAAGDVLVIPDSRQLNPSAADQIWDEYVAQWETVTIASIDGTTVNLTGALSHDHPGGENGYGVGEGTGAADFYPHVGNLTCNVIFRSEDGEGVRGHTMYHGRADVNIKHTRFTELGRTSNEDLSSYFSVSGSDIFSISNTTPISINFHTTKDIVTGEQVKITGATGNTAANGTWTVTKLAANEFSLDESEGNGTYTGGATIFHLGSNQIGRYATHFHHLMGPVSPQANGYQCTFEGNVVDDPLPAPPSNTLPASKWGVTIHGSHYGLYKNNIVHHYAGSGFMTEDGSESFNVFDGNFALSNIGHTNPRFLDGRSGAGFFFTGFNHYVRNNVAAGNVGKNHGIVSGSGYEYFVAANSATVSRNPLFQGADTAMGTEGVEYELVNARLQPILEFDNNEAYGSQAGGLVLWQLGSDGYSSPDIGTSTLSNFKCWHSFEESYFGYPTVDVVLEDWIIRQDPTHMSNVSSPGGITWGDYWCGGNTTITGADIRGCYRGIFGISNLHGTLTIEDCYFQCYDRGISIFSPCTPGTVSGSDDHTYQIDNCEFVQYGANSSYFHLATEYSVAFGNTDLRVKQIINVTDFNGVTDDNFRLYHPEQAGDFEMPATGGNVSKGCPESGLTNAQAYVKYHQDGTLKDPEGSLSDEEGCAIGGAVAPDTAIEREEDGIYGLVVEV